MEVPVDNQIKSRRDFLKTTTLLTGGLFIGFYFPQVTGRNKLVKSEKITASFAPNAFLRISPDNRIQILLSHVEMGQGIWTTLPMLIAEELDADWKDIEVKHSPAADAYIHTAFGVQITGGSSTTWSEFDRYRQAGATARVLLVQAAAKKMRVKPESCTTLNGYVVSGNRKMT